MPQPRPIADELDAEADHLATMAKHLATPALLLVATRLALMAITVRRMERTLDEITADATEDEQATAARQRRTATIAALLPPRGCHLTERPE
jgi:hypothetical protein